MSTDSDNSAPHGTRDGSLASLLSAASRTAGHAELRIGQWNSELRQVAAAGYLHDGYCVQGEILQQRPYSDESIRHDSGLVIQAVLVVPIGIGIVRWDSEALSARFSADERDFAEIRTQFVPYENCNDLERSLLAPHAAELFTGLYNSFGIPSIVHRLAQMAMPVFTGDRLLLAGSEVRRVPRRASNVRCVLQAFEDSGWPESINDPLDDQQLRHRTIQILNEGLLQLQFYGRDNRIYWSRRADGA